MNQLLHGDALTVLRTLPDGLVQTCVTSPPYYGLRDYGIDGQLGLERTPDAYLDRLVEVFREVRRVLRHDGIAWVNIGDSYAADGVKCTGRNDENPGDLARRAEMYGTGTVKATTTRQQRSPVKVSTGLASKQLMLIPFRLALALQSDGWYVRSSIIWHKPNCMPESVTDRPTTAHEHVFLLAKNEHYFYDATAIMEPIAETTISRNRYADSTEQGRKLPASAVMREHHTGNMLPGKRILNHPQGRNKRTVWTIPTVAYPDSHFATFPPKLVEPCILAGSSPRACPNCLAPWERMTELTGHINQREPAHVPSNSATKTDSTGWAPTQRATDQWQPTCTCEGNDGSGQCIILDPFVGAGTVPLVAIQHHRAYLGIDLNPEYIKLAQARIAEVQPVLLEVSA